MRVRVDPYLLACLVLSFVLLFWGLHDRCLWQDEAETALLARSVFQHGVPLAFDEKNLISQEMGRDSDPAYNHLWRWSSWLPIGLQAASIALLGPTTLAARLPSAILGWLTVLAVYPLSRQMFGCVRAARLASVLLSLSTPFLLHARQARWYALAYLFGVLLLWGLWRLRQGRRFGALIVALAAVCLFHANYFIALGAVPASLVAAAICFPQRRHVLGLLRAGMLTLVLFLPGLWLYNAFGKAGGVQLDGSGVSFLTYAGSFLTFLLPLPALVLLAVALGQPRLAEALSPDWRRSVAFLLLLSLLFIGYLSLAPWVFFRYLSVLLPVSCILLALVAVWLWKLRPALALLFVLVLVGSDVLHRLPLSWLNFHGTDVRDRFPAVGPVGFPLAGYVHELVDPPVDAELVLTAYLNVHGRPEDTLLITYGDLPLQYYTRLRVVGGLQGQPLPLRPDWIVVRAGIVTTRRDGDRDVARFVERSIRLEDYDAIELPCPDILLAGNPDPIYHLHRIRSTDARPLKLLRLRSNSGAGTRQPSRS